MRTLRYITPVVLAVFLMFGGGFFTTEVAAQSAENQCNTPDFNITSDTQVYALTGETFSYYVVTENDTSYQLSSSLPSGLSFGSGQISGTPQAAGDYTVEFTASNSCGDTTESISLTVVQSESAVAQADGSGSSAAAGSVGLNEVPDTGLSADTATTIAFYILALLLIAGWFTRRFLTPAVASGTYDGTSGSTAGSAPNHYSDRETKVTRGNFIPSGPIVTESKKQPRRFGDGIRR